MPLSLFSLSFERFVGFRYLRRAQAPAVLRTVLVAQALMALAGLALFWVTRDSVRGLATAGVVLTLVGALGVVAASLLRLFSVFTTVSTMGVVLGVASLVVVFGVTSGFEREFQDKVLGLNAHLIVIPYGEVDVDAPEVAAIKRRLAGLPQMTRMSTFVFSAGEVMVGKVGANLKGVDLKEGADDLRAALVAGAVADLDKPAACSVPAALRALGGPAEVPAGRMVVGAELARKLAVKVGDCVPVMVPFPANTVEPPNFTFKVVGIFRMGFHEYDSRLAYVGLDDARRVGESRSVVGVELRFVDPAWALNRALKDDVRARLGTPHRIIDWRDLNQNLFRAIEMQKTVISVLLLLIIVVAAFNIIASLTMIVLSKTREIAILKSMGASPGAVARIFLVSGLSVGVVGTGLGLAYGFGVCGLARLYGYPLDPKVYLIAELPVQVRPFEVLLVTAVTLTICLIAAIYPAARASRLPTVDGLRR